LAKEAYYFSHDANARQDPKILALISVYGLEGYGRYWVIVEMLREQSDFTLDMQGKYSFNAIAMQMQCNKDEAESFVHDCINEFELFESNGEKFWSNSLLRRMALKEEISMKRKKAAEARWNNKKNNKEDSNGMQVHNESNANAMQGKEKKVKESKKKYKEYVSMTTTEYQKLVDQFGEEGTQDRIENLNLYKGSNGKKYKDDYMTILAWERKNKKQQKKKEIDWEDL
jgi:hypothetical protein